MTATQTKLDASPQAPRAPAAKLRPATPADLEALLALENEVFETDRISRRSFRRLLESPTASFVLAETDDGGLAGYALVLTRASTALARLYSLAVSPRLRGQGLARLLLDAAEDEAYERGAIALRLEVRADNARAIGLYRQRGYRQFGAYDDYYEDQTDALRFEKLLEPPAEGMLPDVPFYEQQTEFTCGAACVMMALAWGHADWKKRFDLELETQIWREATTIFMTSGHGGCGPVGLALALMRRGLFPEVWASHTGYYFLDSVRDEEKRKVMVAAQKGFRREAKAAGIPVRQRRVSSADILKALDEGALVMLLISGFRMFGKKVPHWVLALGHDASHVFIHDPWVEDEHLETRSAAAKLPIPVAELDRMARYGREGLRLAIIIRKAPPK
ncbi:GNAT family N-acetyltransferase/peptidase C39 family protein [Lutibaculum baratangense]|uniref:GNAT family acetyltransferase n=1 Tax=Lutibaculum baratangense AMV1 TaxID=631454 RepID=V4RLG5_9HYPH|nr:GNAT family N-acetyltransferase/peptidase C39 family protein [Lutibaculum baratangense]ESR26159.1 GNAT family acetyltransferase [Lutibaculum baratangense AMV1]